LTCLSGKAIIRGMEKPKPKAKKDLNQLAASIVAQATDDKPADDPDEGKNPNAVALGRLGGFKGGKARAEKLSAKKRKAIAVKAAQVRWSNRDK